MRTLKSRAALLTLAAVGADACTISVIPPPDARLIMIVFLGGIVVFNMPRFKRQTPSVRKCRTEMPQLRRVFYRPTVLSAAKSRTAPETGAARFAV